jgi:tRNA (guanine-N7-)-methyltransferase
MTSTSDARVHRGVVSFVRRSARMRDSQRRAWDTHHDHYVLDVPRGHTSTSVHPGTVLDLTEMFGRAVPLVVEIGPGPGDSLVPMAAARPEVNVLAFEVYRPAIARILVALTATGVDNVRLVEADAVEGLRWLVPERSVSELWTFFPDPWPKIRHHKRRLLSADFADLVAARLRPGGLWRLATDWADYAEQIRELLDAHPDFANTQGSGWAPRWEDRPVTRFESRGLDQGRRVFDLCYRRAD